MDMLKIDFETRSALPFGRKKNAVNSWVYAESEETSILCMSYCFIKKGVRGPVKTWNSRGGQPFPKKVIKWVKKGKTVAAHNVGFELPIWKEKLHVKLGIDMPEKWYDTMAACAQRCLPMGLEDVGGVLTAMGHKKDTKGSSLISKLCSPRRPLVKDLENHITSTGTATPETLKQLRSKTGDKEQLKYLRDEAAISLGMVYNEDEELHSGMMNYCERDVEAEADLHDVLGFMPPEEYAVWEMDQRINNRGLTVDVEAVNAAAEMVTEYLKGPSEEMVRLTSYKVASPKLKQWCHDRGVDIPNLQKDTIAEWIKRDDLPDEVRRVFEIKQMVGHASVKKVFAFLRGTSKDGRARGMLAYHGAGTGRWAGRGIQPQNFTGMVLKDLFRLKGDVDQALMEDLIDDIKTKNTDMLDLIYGGVFDAISWSLRGMFTATEGHVLYCGDYSAIEARVSAWFGDVTWKIDAFTAYDAGVGPDIYCVAAGKIFGYEVTSKASHPKERKVGKVAELALGYQGGVGAWRNFDDNEDVTDDEIKGFRDAWRSDHKGIVDAWYGLERTAIEAVETGGKSSYKGKVEYECFTDKAGKWLSCKLPSERKIMYFNPEIRIVPKYKNVEFKKDGIWFYLGDDYVYRTNSQCRQEFQKDNRGWGKCITYEGRDAAKQGQWGVISTYGGKLLENIIQAISRDVMVHSMFGLEKAGYLLLLTVHDEILSERPKGTGGLAEFLQIMGDAPDWIKGCPLPADGWSGHRYLKD